MRRREEAGERITPEGRERDSKQVGELDEESHAAPVKALEAQDCATPLLVELLGMVHPSHSSPSSSSLVHACAADNPTNPTWSCIGAVLTACTPALYSGSKSGRAIPCSVRVLATF